MYDTVEGFKDWFSGLLGREYSEELKQTAEKLAKCSKAQLQQAGLAILGLTVSGTRSSLGGKLTVELGKADGTEIPKSTTIKTGDVVRLEQGSEKDSPPQGVVSRMTCRAVSVQFDDLDGSIASDGGLYRVVKMTNATLYERMLDTLKRLDSKHPVVRLAFGPALALSSAQYADAADLGGMNEQQAEAVKMALAAERLAIIHGPPGTGKTHTVCTLVKGLCLGTGLRVLVCGASNLSVDNVVERLSNTTLRVLRYGHPARLSEAVLQHSLEYSVYGHDSDGGSVLKGLKAEVESILREADRSKGPKRRDLYREARALRRELREREQKAIGQLLDRTQVVACTLGMAGSRLIKNLKFDVTIIDEASQALEAESWTAALLSPKLVLAGDHKQLPPTVCSDDDAVVKGLGRTLFERLAERYPQATKMLQVQYRMHESIMQWSNSRFYSSELVADSSCAQRTITGIEPVVFIDTLGCGMEEQGEHAESKSNEGEARLVVNYLGELVPSSIEAGRVAVITPYSAQVDLISSMLSEHGLEGVACGTVDGFQGREFDAVIYSTVRSNSSRKIGFLKDLRRCNVAVTRAKMHLCVVGDGGLLKQSGLYSDFVKWLENSSVRYPDSLQQ